MNDMENVVLAAELTERQCPAKLQLIKADIEAHVTKIKTVTLSDGRKMSLDEAERILKRKRIGVFDKPRMLTQLEQDLLREDLKATIVYGRLKYPNRLETLKAKRKAKQQSD